MCTGFAVSTDKHNDPNRCYIHGNISSSDIFSGWEYVKSHYFGPSTTSVETKEMNYDNKWEWESSCWRRPKGKTIIDPALSNSCLSLLKMLSI